MDPSGLPAVLYTVDLYSQHSGLYSLISYEEGTQLLSGAGAVPIPAGLQGIQLPAMAVLNNQAIFFGGLNITFMPDGVLNFANTDWLFVFDIGLSTWITPGRTSGRAWPPAQNHGTMVPLCQGTSCRLFMTGGYAQGNVFVDDSADSTFFPDVWSLDPSSWTWTPVTAINAPVPQNWLSRLQVST